MTDGEGTTTYTYDAHGQISTWTQQTNAGPAQVYTFGYDGANQLIDAVLEPAGGGSVIKDYAYAYDAAGNRTGEQLDSYPSSATPNALNQLTAIAGGGPTRFSGNLVETGAVWVAGMMYLIITYGVLWVFRAVEHRLSGHLRGRPDDTKHSIAEALDIRV
jgi:hypothetical protein